MDNTRYRVRTFCLTDKGATVGEVVFTDLTREQKDRIVTLAQKSPDVLYDFTVQKET